MPKIRESEISEDVNGNIQTIDMMKRIARLRSSDPLIRKLALNILSYYGVSSHNFIDEALAIGEYVRSKVRYVRDPEGVEYLQDPLDLVKQIQSKVATGGRLLAQGDCDDMALLTATLLLAAGHSPFFRAVRYEDVTGPYNHIYVVVYERNNGSEKTRVVLDCILKDRPIGSEIRHVSGEEYAV